MIALLALLACGSAPESPTPSTSPGATAPGPNAAPAEPVATARKLYRVQWRSIPDPPPLSTLFEVEVTVTDPDGKPVEDAKVTVDATMPQHGHGMATKPEQDPGVCDAAGACRHPGGRYRTRGMKFHMPGEWKLRIDVEGPSGTDHLEAPVRM